jgi:hypothetical protein
MGRRTVVPEDEAYELLSHLVASAEICTFEPYYYGTFRLLDAASRLMASMLASGEDDAWLREFKDRVDEKKLLMMHDRERYFSFLGEATREVAEAMKRRYARVTVGGAQE